MYVDRLIGQNGDDAQEKPGGIVSRNSQRILTCFVKMPMIKMIGERESRGQWADPGLHQNGQ